MKIAFIYDAVHPRQKAERRREFTRCIKLLLTNHLLDASEEYDVNLENVLRALFFPNEVVRGYSGRFVAHKLLNDHLIRVVYEYENGIPVVVTLYIARVVMYEDKILSRFGCT
ncbi:hypothetical protein Ferp_1694 [Ferroglobus placidus DSM 10642]|uniref:DUF4258 domain-containing protein n=2 Tax=Ferroglobus placidus TaxID=54261 RepID=D3RZC5_FERPA|nr:hypothetical protein Ferp_1694 [Ferroglobus placidus DSM 10642]